ncbi:MAG: PEP-CTERM sorting domain-containing protein [Rhodoferax sp.]|nr:PEP-CTERM sorting domain-containing protein [Rhodoferax sp.]
MPCRAIAISTAVIALAGAHFDVDAATLSLREWFEAFPGNYPVQSETDTWTFRAGGANGALIPSNGANYRMLSPTNYQQIGALVDTGTHGCTSGFCPGSPATTRATFDGVFVHSGSSTATSAVFRADSAMTLDEIQLWSEGVVNANNGNGFAVSISAIVGGLTQSIGSFNFSWATTQNAKDERLYAPGLSLAAGDLVVISYGNNGSWLYDHGNVDVVLRTSAADDTNSVPEPSAAALALAALGLLGVQRRRSTRPLR